MEGEGSKRSGPKRREKLGSRSKFSSMEKTNHAIEYEDSTTDMDNSSDDEAPPRVARSKGKGKAQISRKRRDSSPLFEEDIMDGFAFCSFKTFEDLETHVSATTTKVKNKSEAAATCNTSNPASPNHISPAVTSPGPSTSATPGEACGPAAPTTPGCGEPCGPAAPTTPLVAMPSTPTAAETPIRTPSRPSSPSSASSTPSSSSSSKKAARSATEAGTQPATKKTKKSPQQTSPTSTAIENLCKMENNIKLPNSAIVPSLPTSSSAKLHHPLVVPGSSSKLAPPSSPHRATGNCEGDPSSHMNPSKLLPQQHKENLENRPPPLLSSPPGGGGSLARELLGLEPTNHIDSKHIIAKDRDRLQPGGSSSSQPPPISSVHGYVFDRDFKREKASDVDHYSKQPPPPPPAKPGIKSLVPPPPPLNSHHLSSSPITASLLGRSLLSSSPITTASSLATSIATSTATSSSQPITPTTTTSLSKPYSPHNNYYNHHHHHPYHPHHHRTSTSVTSSPTTPPSPFYNNNKHLPPPPLHPSLYPPPSAAAAVSGSAYPPKPIPGLGSAPGSSRYYPESSLQSSSPLPASSGTHLPPSSSLHRKDHRNTVTAGGYSAGWSRSPVSSSLSRSTPHHTTPPPPFPPPPPPSLSYTSPLSVTTTSSSSYSSTPKPSIHTGPPPPPTLSGHPLLPPPSVMPPHPLGNMFAPPPPPPPPQPISSAAGLHFPGINLGGSPESLSAPALSNPDMLRARQELNARFLQDRERLTSSSSSSADLPAPFSIRAEMHQHLHQHNHTHLPPGGASGAAGYGAGGLLPPSSTSPHLKSTPPSIPSFLAQSPSTLADLERDRAKLPGALPPGLPGLSPMAPPHHHLAGGGLSAASAPPPTALGSGLHGAFQPKSHPSSPSSAMHHAQLLMSMRDREKHAQAVAAAAGGGPPPHAPPPPGPVLPPPPPSSAASSSSAPSAPAAGGASGKKSGKWCMAHVRIAWQIRMQQQQQHGKKSSGGSECGTPDGRPSVDPLAPPSHLLAPAAPPLLAPGAPPLHRPELGSAAAGLLAAVHSGAPRNPFEPPPPHYSSSLLAAAHLGAPPFQRPSVYAGLAGLSGSAFGGLGGLNPYSAASGHPPPPQEWSRLHRTPPSFPQPPTTSASWLAATAASSKPGEARPRSRQEERDREMRDREHRESKDSSSSRGHSARSSPVDRRPRSRSPLRNGPDNHKPSPHPSPQPAKADSNGELLIVDGNSSDRAESRNGAPPASRESSVSRNEAPPPPRASSRDSSSHQHLHRQDSSRSNSSDIPSLHRPAHEPSLLHRTDPLLQLRTADQLLHSPYPPHHPQQALFSPSAASLLAQRGAGYSDWRGAEMAARLELMRSEEIARHREMERHRDHMISQHHSAAAMALDKYRAELLMRDRMERERLVVMDREREIADRNKAAAVAAAMAHHHPAAAVLRPPISESLYSLPLFPPSSYSRPAPNHSPMLNSSRSSPASVPPPPLMSSTPPGKPKPPSPLVNSTPTTSAITLDIKPTTNGHDPDLTR